MARRKTILLTALCAVCVLGVLAAPASAIQIAPEEAQSPNAESMTTAYWVALIVGGLVLVAIHAGLLAALVRFRAGRGRDPARLAAGRGALRPVIGVTSVLALALFIVGVVLTEDAREVEASDGAQTAQVGVKGVPAVAAAETAVSGEQSVPGEGARSEVLEIDAIAQQWVWRFEYPGHDPSTNPLFSYGELVVPVDTAVVLNITSTDVLHSWWVPALGGQVQAAPGEVSETWFKADEEGRYPGRSTVFSGTAYPVMRSWVEVVPQTDYEAYLDNLGSDLKAAQEAAAGPGPLAEEGG